MEKNYPKMLYKGDQSNFQHIIAENSELERQLKDQGWQEHAELKSLIRLTLMVLISALLIRNPFSIPTVCLRLNMTKWWVSVIQR